VFLISAEAIASDVGLGYRIFLVRRYLSMDIILPYVAWIALLAIVMDVALVKISHRLFPGRMEPDIERALSLRDLWVEYGDKVVLERVNLIEASFVSIIGPSGAGKSSLLRVVLGQERPTRGSILLDGVPLAPNAGRIAAWSSSAIRCFRTSPRCAT
jgi:ABC-type multidrug transport system fused ATPase/permease subunit